MLTRYDEFPVHQTPYPFAESNITDYSFDDGYFFGVFNADADLFLMTGMRVNPNTDMIGAYAGVMVHGRQYTARFSREWRPVCDTHIGPLHYDFVTPFEDIHLSLAKEGNDSALSFDLHWLAVSQAYEEAHHLAWGRGKRTTDQTRYSQSGVARGWIEFDGERFEVEPSTGWYGSRDHSWGIYAERGPLAPARKWLPPKEPPAIRRALRFWTNFGVGQARGTGPRASGFYHLHESETGEQVSMNDTFGTPFDGGIDVGPSQRHVHLAAGSHELTFRPGTRILERALITLTDEDGGAWQQTFEPSGQPWNPHPIGYGPGSWKDGGSMYTYHGPGIQQEWDSFDWSRQPYDHTSYDGRTMVNTYGVEYLSRVTLTAPDGSVSHGAAHTELFLDGRFTPYGFERDGSAEPAALVGMSSMDVAAVTAWLRDGLDRDPGEIDITKFPRGVSRETWLVTCGAGEYTIRQDLPGGSVDPVPLRQEYEIYRRLAVPDGPVPIARPLWFSDIGPAGRPAYLREQVEGDWRIDGWPDPEVRKAAGQEHLRCLAALHTCDWAALGFGEILEVPASPAECASVAVEYFARSIDAHPVEPVPLVHEAIAHFRSEALQFPAPCISLCKGTNGLGEEVWRDGRIVAMSDWELCRLCDPAYDLAQCQELLWDEGEALVYYREQSGIDVRAEHVEFYRRLYSLPMFAFTNHATKCMVMHGDRNARLAWVGTEMTHVATLRMAFSAGFAPQREERQTIAKGGR